MSSIVLIAAVMVSLALGVLVAYGLCLAMFQVFRIHSESVARERALQTATSSSVLAEQ